MGTFYIILWEEKWSSFEAAQLKVVFRPEMEFQADCATIFVAGRWEQPRFGVTDLFMLSGQVIEGGHVTIYMR
jgi:hypothetical protein